MPAAVINGVVLEYGSGLPLARARVRVVRVQPWGLVNAAAGRAGRDGRFEFKSLEPGRYLVSAVRDTYAEATSGQRTPEGFGRPFAITEEKPHFLELRLRKLGVITGRIVDENLVGLAGVPVIAYTATRPVRPVRQGVSDDRGGYRIHSLPPGKYLVRTAPHVLDDELGLLPTYAPEVMDKHQARPQDARLNDETPGGDVRPVVGRLISASVTVACPTPNEPVTVTIASDSIRRRSDTACGGKVEFNGLPPGSFEVYAETRSQQYSVNTTQTVSREGQSVPLQLERTVPTMFEIRPAGTAFTLRARRVDAFGEDTEKSYQTNPVLLPVGSYEFSVTNQNGEPPSFVSASYALTFEAAHPDWHALRAGGPRVLIDFSGKAGSIRGQVTHQAQPAAAVPVFVWPVRPESRRLMNGVRRVITGGEGHFEVKGLPAGEYLLLSSLDYQDVTVELLERARAPRVTVAAGAAAAVSLVLYEAP
jgi:uncharacterized protein (DUF2141 family)